MALALNQFDLFIVSVEFEKVVLEFVLDVRSSVEGTQRLMLGRFGGSQPVVFLDGSIEFRKGIADPQLVTLIPGQDAGPMQILLPRFAQVVRSAEDVPLDGVIERGSLASSISRCSREFHESGGLTPSEAELNRMRSRLIVASPMGRLCYYKFREEFVLEIETNYRSTEVIVESVPPVELLSALENVHELFRTRVLDEMSGIERQQ